MNILNTYNPKVTEVKKMHFTPGVHKNLMHPINMNATLGQISGAGQKASNTIDEVGGSVDKGMNHVFGELMKSREEKRREDTAERENTVAQMELEKQIKISNAIKGNDMEELAKQDPKMAQNIFKAQNDLEYAKQFEEHGNSLTPNNEMATEPQNTIPGENSPEQPVDEPQTNQFIPEGRASFSDMARQAEQANNKLSGQERQENIDDTRKLHSLVTGIAGIQNPEHREVAWDRHKEKIRGLAGGDFDIFDDFDEGKVGFILGVTGEFLGRTQDRQRLSERQQRYQDAGFSQDDIKKQERAKFKKEIEPPESSQGGKKTVAEQRRENLLSKGLVTQDQLDQADVKKEIGDDFVENEEHTAHDKEVQLSRNILKEAINKGGNYKNMLNPQHKEYSKVFEKHWKKGLKQFKGDIDDEYETMVRTFSTPKAGKKISIGDRKTTVYEFDDKVIYKKRDLIDWDTIKHIDKIPEEATQYVTSPREGAFKTKSGYWFMNKGNKNYLIY